MIYSLRSEKIKNKVFNRIMGVETTPYVWLWYLPNPRIYRHALDIILKQFAILIAIEAEIYTIVVSILRGIIITWWWTFIQNGIMLALSSIFILIYLGFFITSLFLHSIYTLQSLVTSSFVSMSPYLYLLARSWWSVSWQHRGCYPNSEDTAQDEDSTQGGR